MGSSEKAKQARWQGLDTHPALSLVPPARMAGRGSRARLGERGARWEGGPGPNVSEVMQNLWGCCQMEDRVCPAGGQEAAGAWRPRRSRTTPVSSSLCSPPAPQPGASLLAQQRLWKGRVIDQCHGHPEPGTR